jgi:hypothetical protein
LIGWIQAMATARGFKLIETKNIIALFETFPPLLCGDVRIALAFR